VAIKEITEEVRVLQLGKQVVKGNMTDACKIFRGRQKRNRDQLFLLKQKGGVMK